MPAFLTSTRYHLAVLAAAPIIAFGLLTDTRTTLSKNYPQASPNSLKSIHYRTTWGWVEVPEKSLEGG